MKQDVRRAELVERLAAHLLREGLAGASLRPMAAAAGTSDRMLLYYFEGKDALLGAVLGEVARQLTALLADALPDPEPQPFDALLRELWRAFAAPALRPYLQLWLEIAASAARGQEPFRTIGGAIADGFLAWGAERLQGEDATRRRDAARLLATVDGLALLAAVGREAEAERALHGSAPAPM